RDVQLEVDLVQFVLAVGGALRQAGVLARLHKRVRHVTGFFLTVLDTDRKAQLTRRQGHDGAGQVSGERGGLGDTGGGEGREQEVLQILVVQRTRACDASR